MNESDQVEEKIYVALPERYRHGKYTLSWVLNHFSNKAKIMITHVHIPAQMIPMMGTNFPASLLSRYQVDTYRQEEWEKADKHLNEYLQQCSKSKFKAEKLMFVSDDVAHGLVELISLHCMSYLVMGAASDRRYSRGMIELKSKTAKFVMEKAHPSCKISFICNGTLVCTRHGDFEARSVHDPRLRSQTSTPARELIDQMESIQISSVVDGMPVHNREDDKKRIMDLVLSDDCNSRNVTPICVIADSGIGKTTLVQLIYADRRISNAFNRRVFIQMTEGFDVKILMTEIIESLTSAPCDITEPSMLEIILKEELMNKKVLIILDGAENGNREFWKNVLTLLNAAGGGSVVLITTSKQEVAKKTKAIISYKLDCLSQEICWRIFRQKAFKGRSGMYRELENVGKELINKCSNNTLGLNLLAGLFYHCTTEEQCMKLWRSVSTSTSLNKDKTGGLVLIIRECYEHLPIHLQGCLDYCSLFSKNRAFLKNHVVHLWLAQGLIDPMVGREPEDVGFEYFEDLYDRSFFQRSPLYDSKAPTFLMHDTIHTFVQEISGDKLFRYENNLQSIPRNIHHLSLVPFNYHTFKIDQLVEKARDLRSFLSINRLMPQLGHALSPSLYLVGLNDLFLNCKDLRALDLSSTDITELPCSISNLSKLQYLCLSNTNIKHIPPQIDALSSLQHFDARNCYYLAELPESIQSLMNLRHLDVTKEAGFVGMPAGIGKLTNLQSLFTFNVGNDESRSGIEELENLIYLRGSLLISGLENVKSALHVERAQFKNKASIESLSLQWTVDNMEFSEDDVDVELDEKVLENLQPCTNLEELIIRNYPGRIFPIWISDPTYFRLVSVVIDGCPNCSQLPALGVLPLLKHLSVQKLYCVETMELSMFPSLESMKIWEMYSLGELVIIEAGGLPCLRSLSISRCPLLRTIPCFSSLLELSIHYCTELPQISDLTSLQCLNIEGFPKIEHLELPQSLVVLKKLEISYCNELSSLSKLTSIEEVNIYQCPKLNADDRKPKPNNLVHNEDSRHDDFEARSLHGPRLESQISTPARGQSVFQENIADIWAKLQAALADAANFRVQLNEAMHKRENAEKDLASLLQKAEDQKLTLLKEKQEMEFLHNQEIKMIKNKLDLLQAENKKLQEENNAVSEVKALLRDGAGRGSYVMFFEFSLLELQQATENFSNSRMIGQGGFGCVYKGFLHNKMVAIKMLHPQASHKFEQEVTMLRTKRHPNIVTLIGTCSEKSALVYEYLPNGSLKDRLACAGSTPPLTWQVRTRIIGEIFRALLFLHLNKPIPIVHGDLKPANILLDDNFVSKLSDLGTSGLLFESNLTRTFAYIDPEFMSSGVFTVKSDVYSFGIIVLQLVTGKPPAKLAARVEDAMETKSLHLLIDKSAGEWPFVQAEKLANLGLRCAQMHRRRRTDLESEWKLVESLMKAASLSVFPSFKSQLDDNSTPSYFICPLCQEVMKDPHIASDGFTYEAEAIKDWFDSGHETSPMTNLPLLHFELTPNHALRFVIQEWLLQHL